MRVRSGFSSLSRKIVTVYVTVRVREFLVFSNSDISVIYHCSNVHRATIFKCVLDELKLYAHYK